MPEDRYLPPGTRVRLSSLESDNGQPIVECGVVIHCWLDDAGFFDCYVAFFGNDFPTASPSDKPYVLRYAATSLALESKDGAQ